MPWKGLHVQLELTDEQRMLAETVKSLLDKRYDANARLELLRSEQGFSREMWQQYAELGLLGLTFDEQHGGAGMGVGELAVVLEAFGRALVLEPFVATVVLGGQLLAAAATAEQKAALLPGVAAGDTLLAFAAAERQSRWSLTDIATTATPTGDGWALTGEKIAVLGGDVADQLLVTAQLPDGVLGVFLIAGDAVRRNGYRQQDGLGAADVLLDSAAGQLLGDPAEAATHVEHVLDTALAMLCAEAVGAMDRMLWLTVDYLKTRVQFGHPIADFQALQFRAADMYVSVEQARSMALMARLSLADDDPAARRRAVQAAKIQVDGSARHVGQEAVQLHGGIGMTMEYPVGHYLKRTAVIAKTLADSDHLVTELGAAGGLIRSA
jgi:alkylation response protein AidB-like acyl-CoA dehydrogenase